MAIYPKFPITTEVLLHEICTDILDHSPYLFIFQGLFVSNHTGPFGTILDDPEHLASRNLLHCLSTGKVSRFRRQGFAQFAIASTFGTMAHFASDRLGGFVINLLTTGFIGLSRFITFGS